MDSTDDGGVSIMATVARNVRADRPTLAELEARVESWLTDAREACLPTVPSADLDWLGGRVAALLDVLAFVREGVDMAPRESLPVPEEPDDPEHPEVG